ncbi:MAG TPA: hypothetical protein VET88_02410 [Gammaproteobacteria bacterium]|nr:hypothetical protein [Gammaproteobacteria bacterium]
MTTKNKTGDRLVASIRRTRAGAENPAGEASQRPATVRKARAPAKKNTARPAKKSAAKQADAAPATYQSGGRVWPD